MAVAPIWATQGLFANILYAQGVSFESLVAVRASVGWVALMIFVLTAGGLFLVAGAYDPPNLEVTPTVLLTGLAEVPTQSGYYVGPR